MESKQITVEKVIRVAKQKGAETFIKFHSHKYMIDCTIINKTYVKTLVVQGKFIYFVEQNCNSVHIGQRVEFENKQEALAYVTREHYVAASDLVGISQFEVASNKSKLRIIEDLSNIFGG